MDKINENLLEAAKNGDFEAVKKAIDSGADVNTVDSIGKTAMILAVNTDYAFEIIKYLLEKGANIQAKDKSEKNVKDHLKMPPAPTEHHENAYEAWIHCDEHFLNTFLYNAMEERK